MNGTSLLPLKKKVSGGRNTDMKPNKTHLQPKVVQGNGVKEP